MPTITNTFGTDEPLLDVLLEQIENGTIQLPDFQRGWVWDDKRIRAIIASVTQGYPMGALMSMETGGESTSFFPRFFAGVTPIDKQPDFLMLDGQQRTTSLYLALKYKKAVETSDERKNPINRYYYLDMVLALDDNVDKYDAVISIPEDKKIKSDFGRKIDIDVSETPNEYESGLFPLNIVFDSDLTSKWVMGFQEYFNFNSEKIKFIFKFQTDILIPFQKYKVSIIKLLKNTPKEAVCQVFEHVNTGGVSLTAFELLTATFAADNFRLRDDWETRKENLQDVDNILHGIDEIAYLMAVTLLTTYRKHVTMGSAVSCKRKDVLRLTLHEYRTSADEIVEGLKKAAKLLHLQNIFETQNLPYQTQLIPLAVICAVLGSRFDESVTRQKIARWFWCGILGELYGGANETRFALDAQQVVKWIDGGDEPATIRDASFNPTRLLSLQTRNSAAYKGVIALLMGVGSRDFISGDPLTHTNYFQEPVDIHHIFPKNYCMKQSYNTSHWNSVINKAPLTYRTNRILGGDAPSIYIKRIVTDRKVNMHDLDTYLLSHLIDPEILKQDAFKVFLAKRAKALLDLIEKSMGKVVSGRNSAEVIKEFEGTLV